MGDKLTSSRHRLWGMTNIGVKSNGRIFGLDLMRAFAIMLVLLLNGDPLMRRNFPGFPRFWFMDGVDLFFVLSGFLIGRILIDTFEKNGFRLSAIRRFWRFRWFRTLPNYYLILVVTLLFVYLRDGQPSGFDWRFLFFLQNLTGPIPTFFTVSWSLVVEEWFYLSFPLLAFSFSLMVPRITARQAVLATTLVFIAVPLILRILTVFRYASPEDFPNLASFFNYEKQFRSVAMYRPDSIAFGVLGAYLSHYRSAYWEAYRVPAFVVGLAMYLASREYLDHGFAKFTYGFTVSSFSLFLLLPLASTVRSAPRPIALPVKHLSVISYSAYLIHRTLVVDAFRAYGGRPFTDLEAVVYYMAYFILTLLLSGLLYRYFEAPMTRLREKRKPTIALEPIIPEPAPENRGNPTIKQVMASTGRSSDANL